MLSSSKVEWDTILKETREKHSYPFPEKGIASLMQLALLLPKTVDVSQPIGAFMAERYRSLVDLFARIAKRCHMPYTDLYKISPAERNIINQMLVDEDETVKKAIEEKQKKQ